MKMYKKSDLKLVDGILVSNNNDVVIPSSSVVEQANKLETLAQQAEYIDNQPKGMPEPSLDGFERVSEIDVVGKFNARTPVLDYKADEAMAIMDEIDAMAAASHANELQDELADLMKFVHSDYVIDCGTDLVQFDTPMLGSVLLWSPKDVVETIAHICGADSVIHKKIDDDDIDDDDIHAVMDSIQDTLDRINNAIDEVEADGEDEPKDGNEVIESLQGLKYGIDDFCNNIEDNQ